MLEGIAAPTDLRALDSLRRAGEAGGRGSCASRTIALPSCRVLGGRGKRDGWMWREKKAGSVASTSMRAPTRRWMCIRAGKIFTTLSFPIYVCATWIREARGQYQMKGEGERARVVGCSALALSAVSAPLCFRAAAKRGREGVSRSEQAAGAHRMLRSVESSGRGMEISCWNFGFRRAAEQGERVDAKDCCVLCAACAVGACMYAWL